MNQRKLAHLNAFRAFEAVGRMGRMTLAATELGVTHGAVSRQVRRLESILGVKLLTGPKNHLELTDAGSALLSLLTPAFDQIEAAVSAMLREDDGILDVSCLATFMIRWLIPRLYQYDSTHALVDVRLSASDQPINFEREYYDIAIRVDDHRLPHGLCVTKLFPEEIGPVMSPELAERLSISLPADLLRVPILRSKTKPGAWQTWAREFRMPEPDHAGKMFEHLYFTLEAATAGLGVCIAPWPLVSEDISAGRLIAPFGFVPSGLTYVATRRRGRNRKAEDFCEWLRQEATKTPPPSECTVCGARAA